MAVKFFNIHSVIQGLFAGRPGVPVNSAEQFDTALPNGRWLTWRNAADTAEVNAIRVDSNDAVVLGTPAGFDAQMAAVLDTGGNEAIIVTATGSAVNEFTVTNAATGNGVSLAASGSDTNVDATFAGKGTGKVKLGQATSAGVVLVADQPILDSSSNELVKFVKTASAVNEVTVTNQATGAAPSIAATGGDTNIALSLLGKGTGLVTVGDSGTASCTGTGATSTATSSKQVSLLTTASLTTAAGSTHTITLTNTKVTANSVFSMYVTRASATTGVPYVTKITPGSGTVDIEITNIHPSAAINGTLRVAVGLVA